MTYQIKLEVFEGPLDLLLHLIKKNEVNIYDIPISLITQQYLDYIELMKELNLEIAGEFLLMAATLIHIKSKMLLPQEEVVSEEEEGEDPRAELVRRLLEYQRFKDAAEELGQREETWREVFYHPHDLSTEAEEEVMIEVGLFDLLDAFREMIEKMPEKISLEIIPEELTLRGRMTTVMERVELAGPEGLTLWALLDKDTTKRAIVITFLALLELARVRFIKLMQVEGSGTVRVFRNENEEPGDHLQGI